MYVIRQNSQKNFATQTFDEGLESLARLLLPEIQKFFEIEEKQKLLEEYNTPKEIGGDSDK